MLKAQSEMRRSETFRSGTAASESIAHCSRIASLRISKDAMRIRCEIRREYMNSNLFHIYQCSIRNIQIGAALTDIKRSPLHIAERLLLQKSVSIQHLDLDPNINYSCGKIGFRAGYSWRYAWYFVSYLAASSGSGRTLSVFFTSLSQASFTVGYSPQATAARMAPP